MNETNSRQVPIEVDTVGDKQTFTIHANYSDKNFDAMKNEDINREEFPSQFQPMEQINNVHQDLVPIGNIEATTCSPELILGDKQVIIWDELCRVCATSNEKLISIFGTEGSEYELETKIREYLPRLRLSQDDSLPLKVCYNCVSILVGWHDIYSKCDQAQERLLELHRELHPEDQPLHSTTSEEISLNNQENHSIDTKDEVQCDPNLIAVLSDNNVAASENKRANGVVGNEHLAASPNHCSEDCSSSAGASSSTGVAATLYQCGVCESLFEQEIELLRHLKGAHKSPANLEYQCTLCLRKFLSKVRLIRHLANHSRNNDLVNPESIAAERHRIAENSGHHYKCEQCQKILSSRLNMIRHLRMHKDERLSVCHVCGKSFRSDGDVKRHINDVHLKLKRHSCEYCGRAFAAKATKDAHQRIHTGEKPFLCTQCPKRFRSINLLGVHKKVHENHRPFGCAYCSKTFRSKQKVQVHEAIHTGYKPFECDICGSAFSSKGECKRHSITHSSDRPFECGLCDKSFKLNKYLRGHLRKSHPKEAPDVLYQMDNYTKKKQRRARIVKEFRKVYVPGMPTVNDDEPEPPTKKKRAAKANSTDASPAKKRKKTLVDKSSKKSDKAATSKRKPKDSVKPSGDEDKPKNVNDEKSTLPSLDLDDSSDDFPENRKKKRVNRTCPDCGKKFRLEESYEMHLRVHQGKLPYICNQCDKQFSQNGSLYYHVRHVHGGVKNHVCDICGRCFAMKTALQDHRRIHTGERPFFCENCGKSFKTKASLYIHGKLHTDEFPFKCSYCNKAFRWKQQMISHVTTHTGEKNHICEICGKGFGVKNELTRHILTHSTEKPFKCETCDISFGQQRYLTNHNRTKHKIKQTDNESLTLLS